jgi:four helix bundle protein
MALRSYRDLIVWQKAMDLAVMCYDITADFPREERFGMISQIRDAASSVPSNIAEGYGRRHRGDYRHHLSIASGELAELETRLLMSERLRFVDPFDLEPIWNLAQEVGKMLASLIDSLEVDLPHDPITGRVLRTTGRSQPS